MTTLERVLFLRHVPAFAALSGEELADVAQVVQEVERSPEDEIVPQGETDNWLYVVVEGRVAITKNGITVAELAERQIFGELSILDPAPRPTAVKALSDVTLLRIEADVFRALAREKPDLAFGVATAMARRLRAVGGG